MIYGAILDGRIAWRGAQRQHAVWCGSAVDRVGASGLWLLSPPPLMRTRLSRLPRWDLLLLKGHKPLWVFQSARSTHRKNGLGLII